MYVLKQLTLLHHSALYGILFKELAFVFHLCFWIFGYLLVSDSRWMYMTISRILTLLTVPYDTNDCRQVVGGSLDLQCSVCIRLDKNATFH